jgi:hypothetical protein
MQRRGGLLHQRIGVERLPIEIAAARCRRGDARDLDLIARVGATLRRITSAAPSIISGTFCTAP